LLPRNDSPEDLGLEIWWHLIFGNDVLIMLILATLTSSDAKYNEILPDIEP